MLLLQRRTLIAFAHTSKGAWFGVLTNLSPDLIAQNLFLNDLPKNLVQAFFIAESVGILDVVENLLDERACVEVV